MRRSQGNFTLAGMAGVNMKMPVINDKRLKKDALWKPLLRHFRQFIRTKLGKYVDINNIFCESGDIK
jgi:hypothetical protein